MGVNDARDNVQARIDWEAETGGTVTLDEAVNPPLWRARDKDNRELTQSHYLGFVMAYLDRLAVAEGRRAAFATRNPSAKFWTSTSDAGPLRYHGSVLVGPDRVESGPHRELGDLLAVMDALAIRARQLAGRAAAN